MNTKRCERCQQEKSLTDFPYHPKTSDKLGRMCKDCKGRVYDPWKRKRVQKRVGYVYLVQAQNGLVKIGIANDAEQRFRSLQAGSPIPLVLLLARYSEDANGVEGKLHSLFQSQHSHGEWFNLSAEQIEQAKEIVCRAK